MNTSKYVWSLGALSAIMVAVAGCSDEVNAEISNSLMSALGDTLASWLNSLLTSLTTGA